MTEVRSVQVLVEGFHDRGFVSGWLSYRGWKDPGAGDAGQRIPFMNPVTGKPVASGRYGFRSPTGATFVEVVPHEGDRSMLDEVPGVCRRASPGSGVLIALDADDDSFQRGVQRRTQAVDDRLSRDAFDPVRGEDGWCLASGLTVDLLVWGTNGDGALPGVPAQHCLERVVALALAQVYPARAAAVQSWLDARPECAAATPKAMTWSHMAGWFAETGCDAFLRHRIWDDAKVAQRMQELLDATPATDAMRRLEA